jgi:hypothetical protein
VPASPLAQPPGAVAAFPPASCAAGTSPRDSSSGNAATKRGTTSSIGAWPLCARCSDLRTPRCPFRAGGGRDLRTRRYARVVEDSEPRVSDEHGADKAMFWTKSGRPWAGPAWYLSFLIPFVLAMLVVEIRPAHHRGLVWEYVPFALLAVSLLACGGSVLRSRRLRREGWVPVDRGANGLRPLGRWRHRDDAE